MHDVHGMVFPGGGYGIAAVQNKMAQAPKYSRLLIVFVSTVSLWLLFLSPQAAASGSSRPLSGLKVSACVCVDQLTNLFIGRARRRRPDMSSERLYIRLCGGPMFFVEFSA